MFIISCISLITLAVQDFRDRLVSIWVLGLLLLSSLAIRWPLHDALVDFILPNTTFALFIFAGIFFWFRMIKGQRLDSIIGLGDLLFIGVMTIILPFPLFGYGLILACLLGLAHHLIASQGKTDFKIPFITWLACPCLAYQIYQLV